MARNQTKFDIWWNSPKTKRVGGVFLSIGASVVITGAMGKILHTSWGGVMLGVGMSVEALLFALGIFDKPHEEFDWNDYFDRNEGSHHLAQSTVSNHSVGNLKTDIIDEEDVKKLSDGIKNLTVTANQLSSLSSVVNSSDKLVRNLDSASEVAGKFISTQESLNSTAVNLNTSYQGISEGMSIVEDNTKTYAKKIDEINKSLSSVNSLYEIQIKNIQSQSEGINSQNELVNTTSDDYKSILSEVQKIKTATLSTSEHVESFKTGSEKLKSQVSELNQIYGNMLNALS